MNAQKGTILHHKNPVIQNHKNHVIQSNREARKDNFSYVTYLLNLKWAKTENLKRYSGKKNLSIWPKNNQIKVVLKLDSSLNPPAIAQVIYFIVTISLHILL